MTTRLYYTAFRQDGGHPKDKWPAFTICDDVTDVNEHKTLMNAVERCKRSKAIGDRWTVIVLLCNVCVF
jgi:hypothetical protein